MAILKCIFVIHTTSKESDANTDASFDLIASKPGTNFVKAFPNISHNEREKKLIAPKSLANSSL